MLAAVAKIVPTGTTLVFSNAKILLVCTTLVLAVRAVAFYATGTTLESWLLSTLIQTPDDLSPGQFERAAGDASCDLFGTRGTFRMSGRPVF